jgi:hypothetical protein
MKQAQRFEFTIVGEHMTEAFAEMIFRLVMNRVEDRAGYVDGGHWPVDPETGKALYGQPEQR